MEYDNIVKGIERWMLKNPEIVKEVLENPLDLSRLPYANHTDILFDKMDVPNWLKNGYAGRPVWKMQFHQMCMDAMRNLKLV